MLLTHFRCMMPSMRTQMHQISRGLMSLRRKLSSNSMPVSSKEINIWARYWNSTITSLHLCSWPIFTWAAAGLKDLEWLFYPKVVSLVLFSHFCLVFVPLEYIPTIPPLCTYVINISFVLSRVTRVLLSHSARLVKP